MEEVTRLLSSGDCVKLWDSVSMMVVDQFNPHSPSHPVTQVCWSSNNQYVASASSSGDKLVLSSIKSSAVPVVVLAEGKKQTCVCLSSSSQYLLSGGLDHTVNIWDLKNRRLHRCLKVHNEEVTSVSFNNNDTYIASGSTSGDIILHSMTTDMTSKAFGHGSTQPVRDLRLSQLKRSLLGSVSDSGTVVLWDSNTQKELHSFHSAHKAPASGLAFSPVSDLLFVTVGLDKKIICYDTGSKIVLRSLRVDCPVTAVDFTPDGTGVVVGTTQGKIYHYDLRNSSAPTRTTAAHRTSVTSLRYQTTNAKANKSNKGMSSKVSNIKRVSIKSGPTVSAVTTPASPLSPTPSLRDTDVFNREAEGQLEAAELLSSLDSKFSSVGRNSLDMFSPARDVTSIPEVLPRDTKGQPLRGRASLDVFSPVGDGNKNVWVSEAMEGLPRDTEGQPIRGRASLDVFSPLRDDTSYSSAQRRTPLGTPLVNPSRAFSPLSIFQTPPIREEELLSPTSPPERISGANLEEEEPSTPPTQTNHLKSVPSFFTPDLSSRTNGIQTFHGTTPTPTAAAASASAFASSLSEKIAEVVGGGGGGGGGAEGGGGGAPFSTLQIHFIKNMIQDTLEDFRDACHRDVVNLQVEMVKQFYIQLNEIHGLIERYSVNDTLVEEIERLKEENKKLRTNY